MQSTFKAPDIECEGCASAIKRALDTMEGVADVAVDIAGKSVLVTHDPPASHNTIAQALDRAGFPVGLLREIGQVASGDVRPARTDNIVAIEPRGVESRSLAVRPPLSRGGQADVPDSRRQSARGNDSPLPTSPPDRPPRPPAAENDHGPESAASGWK